MPPRRLFVALISAAVVPLLAAPPAAAQIVLDRLIVELPARAGARADVEVRNTGEETAYVQVRAAEVLAPGTPEAERRQLTDPEALGLLAAPSRFVLEPGARRVMRVARLDEPGARERIWRVEVRPVSGPVASDTNAVQLLVGYGVLVVGRPEEPRAAVVGRRRGDGLELRNTGNSNALLFDGRQCDASGERCVDLPTKRLYPGNRWRVELRWDTAAVFRVEGPDGVREASF
jgi:P pilus assembly chaperone PapD